MQMELPHRDIYSGIVAEELAKNGAFGSEEDRYVFCSWTPEAGMQKLVFETEVECVREQIRRWTLGERVSDRVFCRERIYDDAPVDALESAATEALNALAISFESQVALMAASPSHDAEARVERYLESLPRERMGIAGGLAAMARQRGLVDSDFRESLVQEEAAFISGSVPMIYGIAYRDHGALKCYANLYLPAVWDRWVAAENPSAILGASAQEKVPAYQRRKQFETYLAQQFDDEYFELFS